MSELHCKGTDYLTKWTGTSCTVSIDGHVVEWVGGSLVAEMIVRLNLTMATLLCPWEKHLTAINSAWLLA